MMMSEGGELMAESISQIQADVSSMRAKYKVAAAAASPSPSPGGSREDRGGRSDSVSPVFSPADSPPEDSGGGDGYGTAVRHGWSATPKQQLRVDEHDGRRALLRSRPVAIRSVVGKPHSPPPPMESAHGSVEFSSSDDDTDSDWVRDQTESTMAKSSIHSRTSRRLDWTPPVPARRSSRRSPSPAQPDAAPQNPTSLSNTPPSLIEEAQMHRMVSRLGKLFDNQQAHHRLQRIRAAPATPRTPRSETRYDHLERLAAEKNHRSSRRLSWTPPSPTVWASSESAFAGLVPPYGEEYSPYSRRTAWTRSPPADSTEGVTVSTPTLRASSRRNSQKPSQRRTPSKKNKGEGKTRSSKKTNLAADCERAYPYDGAKTWRESCRVRGPLSRYPLHEAPTHNSAQVGSVKSGGYVEVLRTDIGRSAGSQQECPAMWVLLAQGGWVRVVSQFCSPSYGQWLAQGGDGTGLTAPDRGPIAVLQKVERPGKGAAFTSGKKIGTRNDRRGSTPKQDTKRPTQRPFYT